MLVALLASPDLLHDVCFCITLSPLPGLAYSSPVRFHRGMGGLLGTGPNRIGLARPGLADDCGARDRLGGGALQRYLSEVIESRISSRVVSRKRGFIIGMQGSNTEM